MIALQHTVDIIRVVPRKKLAGLRGDARASSGLTTLAAEDPFLGGRAPAGGERGDATGEAEPIRSVAAGYSGPEVAFVGAPTHF